MQYNQPFGVSDTNAPYINGNPSTGTQVSIPPAASIEYPQREIVNLISDGLFTPSNADLRQLGRSLQAGHIWFGIDTGSANAISITLAPVPTSYSIGQRVWVKIAVTNTGGATTININGLGTRNVVRANGSTLLPSDLITASIACLIYDGTQFLVTSSNGSTLQRATRVTFTTPGAATFTSVVAGPHKFYVWGAGGGGGFGGGSPVLAGSGGSAGAYIEFFRILTSGQVCNLVIGAGGAAGTSGGANGGLGGSSSATIAAETLTSGGGKGGLTNISSGSTNSPAVATITGTNLDRAIIGQQGGPGYLMTNPTAAGGYGGGAPVGGLGGVGGGGSSGAGFAPGGGGGGSATGQSTTAGARGEIWIEY